MVKHIHSKSCILSSPSSTAQTLKRWSLKLLSTIVVFWVLPVLHIPSKSCIASSSGVQAVLAHAHSCLQWRPSLSDLWNCCESSHTFANSTLRRILQHDLPAIAAKFMLCLAILQCQLLLDLLCHVRKSLHFAFVCQHACPHSEPAAQVLTLCRLHKMLLLYDLTAILLKFYTLHCINSKSPPH